MKAEVVRTREFVREASDFILGQARRALSERGEFRIALSGGNTPRPVYAELARRGHEVPWERVHITFGDERCVPPDDSQSNYRMARESLLLPAAVPERSVARMRGEIDPEAAAREYEEHLSTLATERGETIYRHDVVLLGLGDDGHTASLFPETSALDEEARGVAANYVPKFNSWRLTFTYPLINAARKVVFLISGNKSAALIDAVIGGDARYPAARVAPESEVTWIIAEPA